jgi:hypothetical protein
MSHVVVMAVIRGYKLLYTYLACSCPRYTYTYMWHTQVKAEWLYRMKA